MPEDDNTQKHTSNTPTIPRAPSSAEGYTLPSETLHKVESLSKLRFSLDINAFRKCNNDAESDTQCCTLHDALGADVCNQEVLMYTTKPSMILILQKLKDDIKMKVPFKTCCVVPMQYINSVRNELHSWTHIHTIARHSNTIDTHWPNKTSSQVTCTHDLLLYCYDSSQSSIPRTLPTYAMSKSTMTMTFHGKLSGAPATIGVDSFAGGQGYIHPNFVKQHWLHVKPCVANINLGDGKTQVEATEECIVHLSVGS